MNLKSYEGGFRKFIADLLPSKRTNTVALGSILLFSLVVRLYGIKWGIPNNHHILSYHPDEKAFFWVVSLMDIQNLNFNPHWFIYPTFHYYLVLIPIMVLSNLGFLSFEPNLIFYGLYPLEVGKALLIGRTLSVLFGITTVFIVYLIGKLLYNEEVGILSSLLLSLTPLHVIHSHFLTNDVPVTFWILTTLMFCIKIFKSGKTKWYLLSGASAGFATSTKYTAGLIILSILTAHFLYLKKNGVTSPRNIGKNILLSFSLLISTFIITSPYSILAFSEFKRDLIWASSSRSSIIIHSIEWFDTGPGLIFNLTNSLFYGLGLPVLLFALFGAGISLNKKKPETFIVLSFVIPYYVIVSTWKLRYARYMLPITPLLILFAAIGLFNIRARFKKLGILILIGVVVYTSILMMLYDYTLAAQDPREQARAWINKNIPPGTSIGLPYQTQFFTPPLDEKLHNIIFTWNSSKLTEEKIDYYVLSDFDYRVYLKSNKTKETYPLESAFLDFLFTGSDYKILKTFETKQKFLIIDITDSYLPHDMKYSNPKIVIFKRSNSDG
jgi:4-amino-4-deoxy-L-arabinose transferase-like glycosyltransferase